jgi:imidazolonepropionase-like amidohydrolase
MILGASRAEKVSMMSLRFTQAALLASLVAPSGAAAQSPPDTLAIEHVTVLPMVRDTALADHTVLVSRDRIVWVGPSRNASVPRGARRIDGRGAYLVPGLADMHVHLSSAQELSDLVAAGITTVRNMRGAPRHLAWRDSIAAGTLVGPTIFTSGPSIRRGPLLGRGDPRFVFPNTPEEADRLVRDQAGAGYDMIKVLNGLSLPVYQRLLQAARAARIPVVGHVISGVGLERSVAAGQVSFEHAYDLHQRSRLAAVVGDDRAATERDARLLARANAWVGTIASSRDGDCAPRPQPLREIVASLRRNRVRMLAGTDAGIGPVRAGPSLHCELATLVAAGLTPYEALATATVNAGAFAREHLRRATVPFGTVTIGSRADLLLLAADPRADIGALGRPIGVVLRGQWRPQRGAR